MDTSALTPGETRSPSHGVPPTRPAFVPPLPPPCPPSKATHSFKLCRTTSALAGRAYSLARQVALVLHSMVVLQVCQTKLLLSMDESGLDPAAFRELRNMNGLALRATKMIVQAIG
ncbi:hypothetical protein Q8A67_017301 [Cirrhinus molitorella]|uniref:Uncharacterized protein n=1 Tax=Cirrhinus molitorella TaxID=172907 RepID=A0AA88PQ32_9TELE|nr:hypothetical protein Q8A67_017301 [Cirrhinus molitorella]